MSLSLALHSLLISRGMVHEEPRRIDEFNTLFSNNARSRAERLRELGWDGSATRQTVREAMASELELVLDELEKEEWIAL